MGQQRTQTSGRRRTRQGTHGDPRADTTSDTRADPGAGPGTEAVAEARLDAERRRIERELRCLQQPVTERCPADIVDLAEAALERELLVERAESLRMRRVALDRAEARLAEGVYGRCEVCADAISDERLDILPTTDRCVRHAGRR